ncbi:hypothetical protein [Alicyclobacillus fodiniaquatilis]|uniref:Type II secretion system protein GspF domain-containing protein n=1 Tax=Alicyclobacillus fodiniaquatilis TaxID=1661150 RepID=A0ABW4JDI7_9BACL
MDIIAILILLLFSLTAASIFYFTSVDEYTRDNLKTRVSSQWRSIQIETRNRLGDEELRRLLEQSGVSISPAVFNYIRIAMTGGVLVVSVDLVLSSHLYFLFLMPIIIWFFFEYRETSYLHLARYVFGMLQKQAAQQRNKELFLLFELVYQDLLSYMSQPRSIYSILSANTHQMTKLKKSLSRCLTKFPRNPGNALLQFAEDVGTEEAQQFAKLLLDIETASPEVALDMLEDTQKDFRKQRVALFKQRLYLRGLIGLVLVMTGGMAVAANFNFIIEEYTRALLTLQ